MKILITGGLGYLGGRLAEYLSQSNNEVIVTTRGRRQGYKILKNINVFNIDWDNELSIKQACHGCDVVIHAAGMNAVSCETDPIKAIKFNGEVTAILAKKAVSCGVKNFIYFSTAHVYSENLFGFFNESSDVANSHPYATSHKSGEDSVIRLVNSGEMNGVILRLSNAFGAPIDPSIDCWSLLVNDLCRQAIVFNKIKLKTSGLQYRNFIPIQNLNKIVEFFLTFDRKKYYDDSPIFNVGSASSITVYEMALQISSYYKEKYGEQIKVEKKKSSKLEKVSSKPSLIYSNDKLTKVFGEIFDNTKEEIYSLFNFCETHYKKL